MSCALRILFRWNNPENEQYHIDKYQELLRVGSSDSRFQRGAKLIGVSPRALNNAGLLGSESYHCRISRGRP